MTDPQVAVLMMVMFIFAILLGFPIAFTLVALAVFFGYYAMDARIFDLLVQNTYDIMANDVLTAVPLFLFMGYIIERANIIDRLFYSIQVAARHLPASMAVAALLTCAMFATATGIVGAVVTLMGLLAFPAMLKAGYDTKLSSGVICAGGTLGILIPPSIMLIVYAATAGVSVVRLYAAAMLLGFATPSEAAAVGALGGLLLAAAYGALSWDRLKEATFLTARTTAMVCYLFIGSWTFSSVFSYLGGHHVVEQWVLGMELSPVTFLIIAQLIIFLLGWPLEWTEIIIIFVPIFL